MESTLVDFLPYGLLRFVHILLLRGGGGFRGLGDEGWRMRVGGWGGGGGWVQRIGGYPSYSAALFS